MCYELTWFHKPCFGTAVQSHANPSVKGVLHIADVIQRAVFVCMFIHKGMSHSSVFHLRLHSTNTRIQVHHTKESDKSGRLSESDKIYTDMHKKIIR